MDTVSIWLLISIIVLIAISALFSASETAFSSLNRIRVKNKANEGSKKAKRTLKLVENFDKLLTTILIGNNIVNIVSASLATILFTRLIANEQLAVTLSTIVLTIIVLIFGEITPKSIAKEMPESIAMGVSPIISVLVIFFTPVNWLFTQWKKLLVKMFKPKDDKGMSEQELITIVDEATTDGDLGKEEGELIRSAIEFNDLTVRDIYTPRVELDACPLTSTKEEIRQVFIETGFSRIPIFGKDIDEIVGVLHEKDFYRGYFEKEFNLEKLMSNIECVTLNNNIPNVLKQLQTAKAHMAVVIDEYGGTAGIVTLEDILEELVGEIWDEHDEVMEEIVKNDDETYTVKGNSSVEDMFDYFDMKFDDDLDISTVSGWVIDLFGKMPNEGDVVTHDSMRIEVVETDFRRVETVNIKFVTPASKNNDSEDESSTETFD